MEFSKKMSQIRVRKFEEDTLLLKKLKGIDSCRASVLATHLFLEMDVVLDQVLCIY